MPFYANTPEALLGRSDSKNPSTTCRGITASGRPCRRPIAASDLPPIPASRSKSSKLRVDDPRDENLYCWQHKEQASLSTRSSPGPRMSNTPILEERTSLDTLADRLGLITPTQTQSEKPPRRQNGRGSQPSASASGKQQQRPPKMTRPKPKKEVTFCFCFRIPIEEASPPPRPRPHPLQTPVSTPPRASWNRPPNQYLAPSQSPSRPWPASPGQSPGGRRSRRSSTASQTAEYMSLIPQSASPQTASLLLAELAKPVSQQDDAGYIYIFWLTPETQPATPPAEAASSLLGPSTPTRPGRGNARRPSDVLRSFAASSEDDDTEAGATRGPGDAGAAPGGKKILLKIGRATNVHRRLNEWQRQCGYNLSLIRYYPYVSSSSPAAAAVPRKIPHSHKVERLVHLELAGRGMRVADQDKCATCGREHREWFEVDATRQGVAEVDEVVRRWSNWDEAQG
ncbi:meiotically up-regulated gene 113-domain-containing protein [Lasiosphaeria ovina]|uniref:Meiotically up-regulated gene 113-domain-containing protein n=1 Tax=Lasiosphaeria ovina TaxID=92902 RepID=A0AAE0JYA5_9PEZI|nr:meiotically up-regulated gene 113-domain-containing protein [Lasiosphaeria ovina]